MDHCAKIPYEHAIKRPQTITVCERLSPALAAFKRRPFRIVSNMLIANRAFGVLLIRADRLIDRAKFSDREHRRGRGQDRTGSANRYRHRRKARNCGPEEAQCRHSAAAASARASRSATSIAGSIESQPRRKANFSNMQRRRWMTARSDFTWPKKPIRARRGCCFMSRPPRITSARR